MRLAHRLMPHGITGQITAIVALAVLLGGGLAWFLLVLVLGNPASRNSDGASVSQIATITSLVQAAPTPAEAETIVATARLAGIGVTRIALADLDRLTRRADLPIAARLVARQLAVGWDIEIIGGIDHQPDATFQAAVRVDDQWALLFDAPTLASAAWRTVVSLMAIILIIMVLFVLFLSIYAVRWIIAPLSAVGAAAQSFGRAPEDDQADAGRAVNRRGPREIGQVADALNDMRTRIRALLDDRRRMLAAISHDLRTPLTRLRLRGERVAEPEVRDGILREVASISRMLDETLEYLRPGVQDEGMTRVDLPSLLQTISAEFADVGHAVAYEGPVRLTWTCRPSALSRAISNVVDNGVKHGSGVLIALRAIDDRMVEIDVSDDGPGISAAVRERVFEPFFKGDSARGAAARSGFGLGLSIARDVIRDHDGRIALLDRLPNGLIVRMSLPRCPLPA